MSLGENKAIVRKATEALDRHDLVSLDRFFSPDYLNHKGLGFNISKLCENCLKEAIRRMETPNPTHNPTGRYRNRRF